VILLVWLVCLGTAGAGTSQLWGEAGELWDPLGRLPDFSYAGYRAGEEEVPAVEAIVDVTDHGAVGDGKTDDTAAIQAAIAAASGTLSKQGGVGAVWFPAGTYRLTDRLLIQQSGLVLRGAGREDGGTTLDFEVSLTEVIGKSSGWSYSGGLVWFEPL
jgi:hypothetical protein